METVSKVHFTQPLQPICLPLHHRCSSLSIPMYSIPAKLRSSSFSTKLPSIRAFSVDSFHNQCPQTPILDALKPFLKTTCIAIATAALFVSSCSGRNLAFSAPATTLKSEDEISVKEKEKSLEEFLESHPDEIDSLRSLMEVKIKLSKLDDAIAIIDRLIILDPSDGELPLLRSHTQIYNGNFESARSGFEEVLSKDPLSVKALHGLVMAVSQSNSGDLSGVLKRIEEAMERCKREKCKVEKIRDFELLTAQVRVLEGNYNDALKVYQQIIKEEPRDFRPYLCQGIIYTILKKKDEADKQFEKYRRLVPKGHPYADFFNDTMFATKLFSQVPPANQGAGLKS